MTSTDWLNWIAYMKQSRGWTAGRCLRELGCSPNQVARWSKREPPRYIALACAAISRNIEPWQNRS